MIKLKYVGPFQSEYWEFPTYQEIVRIRNGYCEVKFEDTAQTLVLHGFIRVQEGGVEEKPKKPVPKVKLPEPLTNKEKKVLEMYNIGDASVPMISKALRMSKKKVIEVLKKNEDLLQKELTDV